MNILDLVVGKPIKTSDERAEQIGPTQGTPIFGLDGLSSAAYGPEAALSLPIPLGLLGVRYIVTISAAIITLFAIVYFSYRQTIAAYPSGGGSYTVARFNLGASAGPLAAAALLADYILTAAVGISAGVGALVSAVPLLLRHTVSLCVGILIVITIMNLRGVREAGTAFAVPTCLFVGTLLITIVAGVLRVLFSGGHPTLAVPLPPPPAMTEAVSYWLLLKVFASGCTADGRGSGQQRRQGFRRAHRKNAQRTLSVIIFLLVGLLAGISYLVKTYGIPCESEGF
jgi:amino acid transporter